MAISPLKRRYTVTLTPGNVNRYRALCKKLHLPPSSLSEACDSVIRDLCGTFEMALEKGSFDLSDMFRVMGQQLDLLDDKKEKKANDAEKTITLPERKKGKQATR